RCARLEFTKESRSRPRRVAPFLHRLLWRKKVAAETWHLPWLLLCRCASLVLLEVMTRTSLMMRTGTTI
ncbi:hypothetical protein BGX23_003101, partial [Mortierella sp. AD031]